LWGNGREIFAGCLWEHGVKVRLRCREKLGYRREGADIYQGLEGERQSAGWRGGTKVPKTYEGIDGYCIDLSCRYRRRLLDIFGLSKPVIKVPKVVVCFRLCAFFKVIKVVSKVILFMVIVVMIQCRFPS
jgi:hypothetical protein